jgi:hypothetical protein
MAYNFQAGNNKTKLPTEYESVPQKFLLPIETILQNAKQLQHAHLRFENFRHGNPENNLESTCICIIPNCEQRRNARFHRANSHVTNYDRFYTDSFYLRTKHLQ